MQLQILCHRGGGRLEEENVQVQPEDIQIPRMGRFSNVARRPRILGHDSGAAEPVVE